jgi:hypothetical protein
MAEPALDPRPGARAARALRIRYAVLGVVLAGLWVGHSGEPAWEHALRTVLVLLTIRPLLRLTVKSRMRRGWSQTSTSRQVMWLVAFRLAVVGAALGVRLVDRAGWRICLGTGLFLALLLVPVSPMHPVLLLATHTADTGSSVAAAAALLAATGAALVGLTTVLTSRLP